jgi:hypothetical protein
MSEFYATKTRVRLVRACVRALKGVRLFCTVKRRTVATTVTVDGGDGGKISGFVVSGQTHQARTARRHGINDAHCVVSRWHCASSAAAQISAARISAAVIAITAVVVVAAATHIAVAAVVACLCHAHATRAAAAVAYMQRA